MDYTAAKLLLARLGGIGIGPESFSMNVATLFLRRERWATLHKWRANVEREVSTTLERAISPNTRAR